MTTRRDFVKGAVAGGLLNYSAAPDVAALAADRSKDALGAGNGRKPNIVLFVSDEFRWDFVGASGLNSTTRTSNLDKIAERGAYFTHAVTNQPLCSPSRACMMTGHYGTQSGMWKLPPGAEMKRGLPTLATVARAHGYTANLIGKWHLAPISREHYERDQGYVRPEDRGGFLDLWEASNVLELTSLPYDGTIWDGQGNPIHFHDEYRADFITDLAVKFLKQPHEKPFLLFVSQIEPHFQNGLGTPVAPKGYAERYRNPFVPSDLLHLPGVWQQQLPDYYGCVEKIDESVGRILETLEEQNQLDRTIFLFTSDHGCHFKTRNSEYKRSPQDSSIRVPWLMQGPGIEPSSRFSEIVSNIDLTPTLLDAAGMQVPSSMTGKSLMPLIRDPEARKAWNNTALIQVSEAMVGRAIRTPEWTYCVANPDLNGYQTESSHQYQEYVMYDNYGDPAQLVNLAGRDPYKKEAAQLREQLTQMIVESGEPAPTIAPARLYP